MDPDRQFDLDEAFNVLMHRVNPDVPAHAVQYRESRRIFFAGAAAMFYFAFDLTALDDEALTQQLTNLQKQIDKVLPRKHHGSPPRA